MNRIAVSTLAWKRPQVFEAFCAHFTQDHKAHLILIAGSENDQCEEIAKKYGCQYVKADNKRLGFKANESVRLTKGLDYDYLLLTGSDDFMTANMWRYYSEYKGKYLCLKDLYFHCVNSNRTVYWSGYTGSKHQQPIGAFQLIRRDVIEAMDHSPFSEKLSYPCEVSVFKKAQELGVNIDVVSMSETKGFAVDVKTDLNITKFNLWQNARYCLAQETIFTSEVIKQRILEIGGKV
jgi:hypothetical protein